VSELSWIVNFSARAKRDLRRLDPPIRARMVATLERLATGNSTADERKLKGIDEWRIRVGDWRVRFTRDDDARTIYVTHILPRGRAYDR
jgi:mRNA interferase RelE/StbE